MNDPRAAGAPGKPWGRRSSRTVRGRAWGRSPLAACGRVSDLGEFIIGPGRRREPVLNPGRWLRDKPDAARQSRLNTTDASQPVMTAIMAVTTP
jgi:hypothetical protein